MIEVVLDLMEKNPARLPPPPPCPVKKYGSGTENRIFVQFPTNHRGQRWFAPLSPVRTFAQRHEGMLWWIHSLYALALGVGFMWLGARNFTWLRVAALHIGVIWVSSLVLANYVDRVDHASVVWQRVRLVINYVTKNFYQQILFFILPIYFASATLRSRNALFVILLAVSAVLSTLDVIYDRILSARRRLNGLFFAFNLFAAISVALPVLWSISTLTALRIGTAGAVLGFVTIARRPTELTRSRTWFSMALGAVLVFVVMELMRPFVPPAPLRLTDTTFSLGLDRESLVARFPVTSLRPEWSGRVYAVTSLHAPLGLRDRVELRWYRGSRLLWISPAHDVIGGRRQGFRLWSSVPVTPDPGGGSLRMDVVTDAGQLIGRQFLPVGQ